MSARYVGGKRIVDGYGDHEKYRISRCVDGIEQNSRQEQDPCACLIRCNVIYQKEQGKCPEYKD